MRTAGIIQARMGSSRLAGKVMMPVLGKPLLGWMLDRVSRCHDVDEIVVATTLDERDDVIARFVEAAGYRAYRGSENDVLDRYYQAAVTVRADAVARITADCPLLDPMVLGSLIGDFKTRGVDFLSNSEPLPSSWPDGMDISIVRFDALQKAWQEARKASEREHVTFFFWSNPHTFTCERVEHCPDWSKYRVTIDYPNDFLVVQAIIQHFGPAMISATMDDIVAFLDAHPDVFKLNDAYTRGMGWQPALEDDERRGVQYAYPDPNRSH